MIKAEVLEFEQLVYNDAETGKTLQYNLFIPKNMVAGEKYPLVLFMADASTPGTDVTRPLTQGYGALVWATEGWQAKHPCYVLVPQYSDVAVNDAYEHTDEVDMVMRLVKKTAKERNIDSDRLYTTGQSMGGMISMYFNVTYPDVFAASIFVDCHWDSATFPELVKHKFTFITAGKAGTFDALETAAKKAGIKYEYEEWSAKLPQQEQDRLASEELAKGAPINIINFASKTVLPADGKLTDLQKELDALSEKRDNAQKNFHEFTEKNQEQVRMRLTDAVFARMVVDVRSLLDAMPSELKADLDGEFLTAIAERPNEILKCAMYLFLGYLDGATKFAQSCGGGGTSSDLPWGRNPDEDNRRFAYRCMMQAHKMLKRTQPKRGVSGRR